jgi:cation transport ATPase
MALLLSERSFRRALIVIALVGLAAGFAAWIAGRSDLARWCWMSGTVPVVIGLSVSIVRDLLAGRMGVDSIALVSMSGALALGEALAGIVVAIMYAGGNVLEDIAVARAERDLRSLIDRAPRIAHRREGSIIADTPIEQVTVGDLILVRGGEAVPVDGVIASEAAVIDESALSGEPIPVSRQVGELARSGSLNAGGPFEIRASATAGESTYAGIVRSGDRGPDRKVAVHPRCGSLRAAPAAACSADRRRRLVLFRRSGPRTCRAGGGDPVSADFGRSRRLHFRNRARRKAGHSGQGQRSA